MTSKTSLPPHNSNFPLPNRGGVARCDSSRDGERLVFLDSHALNPGDLSWAPLQELGTLVTYPRTRPEEVVERAKDADVVILNKVRLGEEEFRQLPQLRLILVAATGYDVIDLQAARRHGITVCNVPAYSTLAVAQHTLALILAVCNRVEHYTRLNHEGYWDQSIDFCLWNEPIIELTARRIALVGLGSIGQKVAQLLLPLEAEVLAVTSKPQEQLPQGIRKVTIEEAFQTADIISLHCPLDEHNRAFVNATLLAQARPGLMLINTARGGLIDDEAVAQALRTGQLGYYCCDVLSQEPPRADHPILHAPHTMITPHIAWASQDARSRIISIMTQNLRAFLSGHPQNIVGG